MNITLTPSACEHIQKILDSEGSSCIFRLALKKSGCSGYRYDPQVLEIPVVEDVRIEAQPGFFIYVQSGTEEFFNQLTLDVVEKNLGNQLIFTNPNADNECGCGESFNLKKDIDEREELE